MNFIKKLLSLPLFKDYQMTKEDGWQGGWARTWTVRRARRDLKENENASLFLAEKKIFKGSKQCLAQLKRQPDCLMKYRHPNVLSLIEPFKESETEIGFVTERVQTSLGLALQKGLAGHLCSEMEVKIMLIDLLEALDFLHNSVKVAHLGISPDNIYLAESGKWKLGGFMNSQLAHPDGLSPSTLVDFSRKFHPELAFCAPELVEQSKFGLASDTFSMGLLILTLVKTVHKQPSRPSPRTAQEHLMQIKSIVGGLDREFTGDLLVVLKGCLGSAEARLSVSELKRSRWLNDNFMHTYKYLSNITELDPKQQKTFVKGITGVLFDFEKPVLLRIIMPALLELLKFDYLAGAVVMNVVELVRRQGFLSKDYFSSMVWPQLKPVTARKQMSAMLLYQFVNNVECFSQLLSPQEIECTIFPLQLKCLEVKEPKLQVLSLRKVQFAKTKFDYLIIKSKLLPRLLTLASGEQNLEVRKCSFIALLKLREVLDPSSVTDQILPILEKSRVRGGDPFINAIILKLYSELSKNMNIEAIGLKILPSLLTALTDMSLNRNQFLDTKALVTSLVDRIEAERAKSFVTSKRIEHVFQFPPEEIQQPSNSISTDFTFLNGMTQERKHQIQTAPARQVPELAAKKGFQGFSFQSNPSYSPPFSFGFGETPKPTGSQIPIKNLFLSKPSQPSVPFGLQLGPHTTSKVDPAPSFSTLQFNSFATSPESKFQFRTDQGPKIDAALSSAPKIRSEQPGGKPRKNYDVLDSADWGDLL